MKFKRYVAILKARNLEFLRDRAALSWNLLFPILLVFGFAFAFNDNSKNIYKIAVYATQQAQHAEIQPALSLKFVQYVSVDDVAKTKEKVRRHQFDLLLDLSNMQYWVNDSSPKGYFLEQIIRSLHTHGNPLFVKQVVQGEPLRYVDWVVPGIFSMNVMFSALFGIGYVIVRYRKNGVLKRLKATPLSAFEFLSAQVTSRLLLILTVISIVYLGTNFFIDFRMYGSYGLLFFVFFLGTTSLISLGLLVAARITSEELAGGLLNLISWPMMFLSGVWFSLEGTHPLVQKLSLCFPLTHLVSAARAIMLDGATAREIYPEALVLVAMTLVFLSLGAKLFRWE